MAGGADEIAQDGDVGAIGADAAGIDRQAEALGEIEIHACIIQLRQTEAGGGLHALQAGGINGPWRTVPLPGPSSQFVELFPIAFVPSVHRSFYPASIF